MNKQMVKKGFTLIELLVVISIIAVLMSIMMPALGKVREQAKTVVCKSNLKQTGVASSLYTADSGGVIISSQYPELDPRFVPAGRPKGWVMWFAEDVQEVRIFPNGKVLGSGFGLGKYIDMEFKLDPSLRTTVPANTRNVFNCPSARNNSQSYSVLFPDNIGFGINNEFVETRVENIKTSHNKVLFADAAWHTIDHDRGPWVNNNESNNNHQWYGEKRAIGRGDNWSSSTGPKIPVVPGRHNSKDPYKGLVDILFVDGHAGQVKRMDMTRSMFDNDKVERRGVYDQHRNPGTPDNWAGGEYGFED